MTRDSALLYRSQVAALRGLPPEQFKSSMLAILDYSLDGVEPDGSDSVAKAMWMMAKPLIDKRNKNYENGSKPKRTGSEPEANLNPTGSEPEANPDPTGSEPLPKGERRKDKGEILTVGSKEPMSGNPTETPAEYPYKAVIDCLNKSAGTSFRDKSKDTRKHIKARFDDGYSLADFENVIQKKCAEWMGTDMEKYLRPSTLFGSKFEAYLNQAAKPTKRDHVEGQYDDYERDWTDHL